jgi:hypothetical protein
MTYDAICIPTYDRADTISEDTIGTLLGYGTPPEKIHVFVGPKGDYTQPKAEHPTINWHTAPAGYGHAQNHIRQQFPAGHRMVLMDDDVRGIRRLAPGGKNLEDLDAQGWEDLTSSAFEQCRRERVTLWGLNATGNHFYMRNRSVVGLYFAIGNCFGYINDPTIRVQEPSKQDYEITLIHYERDGGVLRVDDHTAHGRPMRTFKGGQVAAQGDARVQAEHEAQAGLLRRFPALVHPKDGKSGYPEIALRTPKR